MGLRTQKGVDVEVAPQRVTSNDSFEEFVLSIPAILVSVGLDIPVPLKVKAMFANFELLIPRRQQPWRGVTFLTG